MTEILFSVVEAPEGGLTASAVEYSIVTEADTLDKVSPDDFRKNMASLAVMSFAIADMPQRLVATPPGRGRGRGPR